MFWNQGLRIMPIDYLGAQGGSLALAFGAGCTFISSTLWVFIILPMKTESKERKKETDEIRRKLEQHYINELNFYRQLESVRKND